MSKQKNRKNPVGSTISDCLRKKNRKSIVARAASATARFLSGIVEGAYVATIGKTKVKAQGRRS